MLPNLIIADSSAMEGVLAVVLVFRNVRCHTLDGECAIFDPICIPSAVLISHQICFMT